MSGNWWIALEFGRFLLLFLWVSFLLPCQSQIIHFKTQELILSSSNAAPLFPWTFIISSGLLSSTRIFSSLRSTLLMLPSIALLNLLSVFFSSRISVCLFKVFTFWCLFLNQTEISYYRNFFSTFPYFSLWFCELSVTFSNSLFTCYFLLDSKVYFDT